MIKQFFWSALAVAILGVFIIVYLSPRPRLATEQTLRDHDHIFDFIIIGAGTAGCVIASELARRGNFSVLLIEEGGLSNYGPLSLQTIPLFAPDNNVFGGIDYEYHLDPQSSPLKGDVAPGNPARRINSPRGRVLGGSGELNFMMHVRPSRGDYDSWVELSGDSSWGYENMHQLEERLEIRGDQHKDVGVHVETPVEHPLVGTLMAGAGMTEWGNSSHYNFGARRGGGRTEYSTKKGTRASTVRGYLLPTLKTHPNLHALVQTKVLQILFHQGKVTGVEVLHNKKKVIIKAAKEVVLSSGTYASPQLLLLSGIGTQALHCMTVCSN
jgi:choline dehydrogenase